MTDNININELMNGQSSAIEGFSFDPSILAALKDNIALAAIILLDGAMSRLEAQSKDMLKAQVLQSSFAGDQSDLAALLSQLRNLNFAKGDSFEKEAAKEGTQANKLLHEVETKIHKMYGDSTFDASGNITYLDPKSDFASWVAGQVMGFRADNSGTWDPEKDPAFGVLKSGASYFYSERDQRTSGEGLGQMLAKGDLTGAAVEIGDLLEDDEKTPSAGNLETLVSNANRASTTMQGVDQQKGQFLQQNSSKEQTESKTGSTLLDKNDGLLSKINQNMIR